MIARAGLLFASPTFLLVFILRLEKYLCVRTNIAYQNEAEYTQRAKQKQIGIHRQIDQQVRPFRKARCQ